MNIRFGEQTIEAQPGDTVASALYRAGRRIFSRGFKYHRPRGLLCVSGKCPNCLMNVNGVPNVRTCVTPAREGMLVRPQNASPSLEHDRLAVSQRFDWLMPVGWYYKVFRKPAIWHAVEPWIRRVAGLGEISQTEADDAQYEHSWMHAGVAVIGGGFAGLRAAVDAAQRGDDVVLVDDQPALGGEARWRPIDQDQTPKLIAQLADLPNVRVLKSCSCIGLYEGNLLGILQPRPYGEVRERLIHLRARDVVIATGAWETPLIFPNNDLPGVMLASGVQRLWRLHGIAAGKRAVIAGDGLRADEVGADLDAAGVEVVAVAAPRDVIEARGASHVEGIQTRKGSFACDLVVMCGPRVPDVAMAAQAGAKMIWNEARGAFLAQDLPAGISVVGDAGGESLEPVALNTDCGKRTFVCLCSDVTSKDICGAVSEGFDHIETLKRYTTATMGPCQGRMCQLSAIALCAKETGRTLAATGVTTSRPPNPGVTLGALAGARHHPIRRTPLHYAHEALGAVWLDMGEWKRPRCYRSSGGDTERAQIEAEYQAVRQRAGIIDVSTLGKLHVRGRDAGQLLDKVYTHRFSDLKPGRVRYALMCDEGGIILDDGTISRLAPDHYFVTTTTGNLDFVHQWLDWYLIGSGWDVQVTNVTAGYGSVNVAGPMARDVLARLTECDLSPNAFPYMACRHAAVNGIECILLRIGFVGETGWEIHAPAESAEDLWDALLAAGDDAGLRPFGVEAQRLLRLEKRHVIVGVDTDALSGPYEAGLGWAARLEKDDFVGKLALGAAATTTAREQLVGFVVRGRQIPEDGAAVVVEGRLAGRVTSSRYSPQTGAAIGLAWVPSDKAREGAGIEVRVRGELVPASVTLKPFYDPEGARLRS